AGAPAKGRPSLPAPAKGGAGRPAPAGPSAAADDGGMPTSGFAQVALYARFVLSFALGVGVIVWPYDAKCGARAGLVAPGLVAAVVSGVWSAVWSWRHRAPKLHTLSLLLLLWGLVLGGLDVLPRVGYAKPTALHPAAWACK